MLWYTSSKKQYGLKAGLCRFTHGRSKAVMKELTQFHTLNYFHPCNPATLTCTNRHNALTSLMFSTEKCTGEVKACACTNGSAQRQHIAKEEATAPTVTLDAIFIQSTIFSQNGGVLPHVISWAHFCRLITQTMFSCIWMVFLLN
jgi:hypothetical protein